jgi:hypothetical protein
MTLPVSAAEAQPVIAAAALPPTLDG